MELPVIPASAEIRFRTCRATRWCDEDNQKVVNNAVYMTLLEEARFEYFNDLGLLKDNQFPFVLMQTNIRFLHPGRGARQVEIELKTVNLGQTSIRQVARIRDVRSGTLLVEAEVLLVSWSNETRSKAPTSSALREAVLRFEASSKEA